jgi:ADP-ribosylglycohydrolase
MSYPKFPDFNKLVYPIEWYARLKTEYGAKKVQQALDQFPKMVEQIIKNISALPNDPVLAKKEPNDFSSIKKLRPAGPRKIWKEFNKKDYRERLEGALLGRMAGCTLGSIVEGWAVEAMEKFAHEIGDKFPPVDYWSKARSPFHKRYDMSFCYEYTRSKMNGVPADDDILYTILGLLVAEDYGLDFTVEENGKAWVKYLSHACTAEAVALENLKKGISAKKAGEINNPYCEFIGADIRSDPWGYLAPGLPEKAAQMAYNDAYLSHRRNGIYGEMYFSAAISAAFTVDDPIEALHIGLTEIPAECNMAKAVRWALKEGNKIKNYKEARVAVDNKFVRMNPVHTINNACLTIFGIMIGKRNFTRVISETVAMGMDNDCTAATAGSLVGAVVGKKGIAKHWYKKFNNTIHTYIIGQKKFKITDIIQRYVCLAEKAHQ